MRPQRRWPPGLRIPWRVRRYFGGYWLMAAVLAVITGVTVARLVGTAADRAEALGGLVPVAVTTRPVGVGARLGLSDVTVRRLPRAAVPDAPVARPGWATGRTVLVPMVRGEVVLEAKLSGSRTGGGGIARLVPAGMRALAVPVGSGGGGAPRPPLRPGDIVDVLATFDVEGDAAPTFPVATGALVLVVGREAVTVAVPSADAPRVAFAIARATVTLALASPS